MTLEEEYTALYVDPPEIGLEKLTKHCARLMIQRVSSYRNIPRDELMSLAYRGIQRCYKHYQRHPTKHPGNGGTYRFGISSFLWILGSLHQGAKFYNSFHNNALEYSEDTHDYEDFEVRNTDEVVEVARHVLNDIDYQIFNDNILHNTNILANRIKLGLTLDEYLDRVEEIKGLLKEAL